MFKDYIIKHLKLNYIFYIGTLIILYILSKKLNTSFLILVYSFIVAGGTGYFVHVFSHKFSFEDMYTDEFKNYYSIVDNSVLDRISKHFIYISDFHRKTHHDTEINKKYYNLIMEFIQNFVSQGVFPIIAIYLSKFVNYWIFILWGLTYATVHIINFNIFTSKIHEQHHLDDNTNYGMELYDIIFKTKYNDELENINHYLINFFVIAVLIYFFNNIYVLRILKEFSNEIFKYFKVY